MAIESVLPTGADPIPETPIDEVDRQIGALKANAPKWVELGTSERAKLLRACIATTLEAAQEGAAVEERCKGSYGFGQGEALLNWAPILIALNDLAKAMDAGGQPALPAVHRRSDGQVVVDVWPTGLDAVANRGFKGSIWLIPGKEPEQGAVYRAKAAGKPGHPSVSLVLGAGNQIAVAVCDILHKLIVDDAVVICKMNPVNEAMGPSVLRALSPLVEGGYMAIVYGGASVGHHLCTHPEIDSIHLTGSAATYDAIVWQGQPKTSGAPPCKKEVGAELGCVTPYLVVPGPWTEHELRYQAANVASALVHNSGHNCLKAELVIVDADWELRDAFVLALRQRLAETPRRVAWYPGSNARFDAFRKRFPNAEELGVDSGPRAQPWLLATGLTPETANPQDENWCGVLQEVEIPGTNGDASEFLSKAVTFANEKAWGSLSAGLIVHPTTRAAHAEAYDKAIAELRYGSIAVNGPTLLNFLNTAMPWGAFPGSTPQDIGSGNCFVHNTKLLDHVQKGVVEAPWIVKPAPAWMAEPKALAAVAPAAVKFFAYPSIWSLVRLIYRAVRSA